MREELTLKAAALARSSPQAWAAFVEAFRQYAAEARENLVQADLAVLQGVQGRAQQCAALQVLFTDAAKDADRIEQRRQSSTTKTKTGGDPWSR